MKRCFFVYLQCLYGDGGVIVLFLPSENYQYTVLESLPVRSVVAKIKAADADIGSNAEMDYRIMDSDGPGVFNVTTDEETQDGVITLLKVAAGRMCSRRCSTG